MSIIHAANLSKVFRVLKRKPGFLGSLRTLFSSDYEQVQAVQDISRVIIIDKGRLIYDGSLSAIKQRYGRRRRVTFATEDGAAPAGLEAELAALGDGIQVASGDEGRVVVSFDPHTVAVSALTRAIVNHHVVTDLTVEEADLEGIIRQIYSGAYSLAG